MKTSFKIIPLSFLTATLISGCSHKTENYNEVAARQLFDKSVKLIELYTDSVRISTDSVMLKRLSAEFSDRMSKINFQFPADTDLHLSEQENDSIIKAMDKLVAEVKKREKQLAAKNEAADSLDNKASLPANESSLPTNKASLTANKSSLTTDESSLSAQ